jgi:anti-anti-sigma regulatory factor
MTADLKLKGRFDDAVAAALEKLAQEARNVTIDMSEASGIDGAALCALVQLHKRIAPDGFKVRVAGANANVRRLFETFHVADLFFEGMAGQEGSALRSGFFGLTAPAPYAPASGGAAKKSSPDRASKRSAPKVTRFDRASHSVKVWLDSATVPGGELRGGDALKSYRRWAEKLGQDVNSAEFRKHLAAILGSDRIVPRTSGYIVRGIQLRAVLEAGKKQAATAVRMPRGQFAAPARMDAIAALSF